MNIDTIPDQNLILLTPTSQQDVDLLAGLPAWRGKIARGRTPMVAIDAARGVAALTDTEVSALAPLVLIAPPLAGISRAIGLKLIVDAFGYRRFNRPFGPDTMFANPDYIAGHAMVSPADIDIHLDILAGAVGLAVMDQPRGTIWDLHAPVPPNRVLANPSARVIMLARDPRDAMVSAYFFYKRSTELAAGKESFTANLAATDFSPARKEAALMTLIADGYAALSAKAATRFVPPRQSLDALARCLASDRVFVLRYERQHRDPHRQYAELISWLSAASDGKAVPGQDALIAEAIKRGTFAHQTNGAMIEGRHNEAPAASPTGHVRKGIVGDWRNHFTPAVARAFHDSVGSLLIDCGFETNRDWWKI